MAGDGSNDDVKIPAVLLFSEEGRILKNAIAAMEDINQHLTVRLASKATGMSGMTTYTMDDHILHSTTIKTNIVAVPLDLKPTGK